jgi:hypothetical protein
MDGRWPLGAVEDDDFEKSPRGVRPEDEVAGRVLADLLHDECSVGGVADVLVEHPRACGLRRGRPHSDNVVRNRSLTQCSCG